MKKIIIILLCLAGLGSSFGQSNKVQTVINLLKQGNDELDRAMAIINQASVHPRTMTEAKTWYQRGIVYYRIYQNQNEKYKDLDPNPLKQAYRSFMKARELDATDRYDSDLRFELTRLAAEFFNKGTAEYEKKQFLQSVESYESAMAIGKLPYINQLDTMLFFNAALSADEGKMYEKAIEYYSKSIELKFNRPEIFHYLADVYLKKGDSASAFKTYGEGIVKFPDNNTKLYLDMINFYLCRKDIKSAFGYIEIALIKDSANAGLWMVYGRAVEDRDRQEAIRAYQKAIAIDPSNFNASYSAGTIYYNMGVDATKKAIRMPLDDQSGYKAEMEVADHYFRQALSFFEEAYALNREDPQLLSGLSQIYYRFKMDDKLNEVKRQIEKLK